MNNDIQEVKYPAGIVTAYGAAVKGGYTGTYEEFCQEQAGFAGNAQQVAEDRAAVEALVPDVTAALEAAEAEITQAVTDAEDAMDTKAAQTIDSIPSDYTELSNDVSELKSDLNDLDATVNGVTTKNYTEGKNLSANSQSHSIIDDSNSCISDYIPKAWGDNKIGFRYTDDTTDTTVYNIFYFDSNKDYIGYAGRGASGVNLRTNLTPPNGTAYIRISFKKGFAGTVFKYQDETTNYYTATATTTGGTVQKIGDLSQLNTTGKSNLVEAINEVKGDIPAVITPFDTNFFHISKNLINPDECTLGEYVNQANGNFSSNSDWNRTGYVPVIQETQYVFRAGIGSVKFRYAFYNSSKTYISGAYIDTADNNMLITSPSGAAYCVVSSNYLPQNMMLAKYENEDKTFESYNATHIYNKYIQADADSIILNLPEKIYALVGYELNVYFENITDDPTLYKWNVTCDKGMQLERGYQITPSSDDVGQYTLKIRASINEAIYKEATATLVIASASAGSGESTSVIVLGDSTTDNGTAVTKLNANFADDVMSISTLGTRGTSPNNEEGRSGWNLTDYFTKASITYTDGRGTIYNPFYNPTSETFDASYYFTNSGIPVPEWFIINMGINDVFGYESDATVEPKIQQGIDYIDAMIESLHTASENLKVCICCTIPPNHSQDAFGKAYQCGQTRNRYKRNNALWVNRLIAEYDGRTNEGIYVIPIHTNLDTIYNMGLEEMPVNARNTSITYQSPIQNGGVHPVTSGYWQIADVYTAFLKGNVT